VVTTLLFNFIVLLGVGALLDGAMKDPTAMGWPQSVALQGELELAKLVERTRVHTGLLWAVGLAVLLWALFKYTVLGFDIRATGANARAAAFAGVPVTRTVVLVALLSGALAGLAGAIEVAGRTGYVTLDMSPGYGYSGIVIAMLAALHPLGVLAASVFVAGVLVGADSMSRAVGVPTYIADVIVAASLISVLVATCSRNTACGGNSHGSVRHPGQPRLLAGRAAHCHAADPGHAGRAAVRTRGRAEPGHRRHHGRGRVQRLAGRVCRRAAVGGRGRGGAHGRRFRPAACGADGGAGAVAACVGAGHHAAGHGAQLYGYRVSFPKVNTPPTITPFQPMEGLGIPVLSASRRR
jgi:hypothetical protein